MFGNKTLDFNEDTSPFGHLDKLLASSGKSDLGSVLLEKTKKLGDLAKNFRVCLISQIAGGE